MAQGSVVACRLSCPGACGIPVPWLGIEPESLILQAEFLTTGPPGKSSNCMFNLSSPWLFCHHLVFLYNEKCERRKCLGASPCRTGFMTCAFLTSLNVIFAVLTLLILPGQGAYILISHWAPQIIELVLWSLPSSVSQTSRKLELSEVGWNTKEDHLGVAETQCGFLLCLFIFAEHGISGESRFFMGNSSGISQEAGYYSLCCPLSLVHVPGSMEEKK